MLCFDLLTRPKMPFKVMHRKEGTYSNGSYERKSRGRKLAHEIRRGKKKSHSKDSGSDTSRSTDIGRNCGGMEAWEFEGNIRHGGVGV